MSKLYSNVMIDLDDARSQALHLIAMLRKAPAQ